MVLSACRVIEEQKYWAKANTLQAVHSFAMWLCVKYQVTSHTLIKSLAKEQQ